MEQSISELVFLLEKKNKELIASENNLLEKSEELEAQKEELTAAVEQLIEINNVLKTTLAELKERNTELDQLVYRTSHDLKTPITSTLGLISLMEIENISPVIKKYTQHIKTSMEQMKDLLYSISLFSEVSLNKLQYEKTYIYSLFLKSIDALSAVPGFEKVAFILPQNQDIEIETDAKLLGEVFKYILANAITFGDDINPKITITIQKIVGEIEINISDNGKGIDSNMENHVFDIFYRGSNKSKGAGLGLYVSKKIVTQLKGKITLSSSTKGLNITILLPTTFV